MSFSGLHTYIILLSLPATVKIYPDKQLQKKSLFDSQSQIMVYPLKQQELEASRFHPQSKAENNELIGVGIKF